MYKLLLILRYLLYRRIAWVALIAVTLCTTMVLVVISVMGGWIDMFRDGAHSITGDIVIASDLAGFPCYQEMMDRIAKLSTPDGKPLIVAQAPVIRSLCVINIGNRLRTPAEIVGLTEDILKVNNFGDTLYLRNKLHSTAPIFAEKQGLNPDRKPHPGIVVGTNLALRKDPDGKITRPDQLYLLPTAVTVMPWSPYASTIDTSASVTGVFWIVDDSQTKVYSLDQQAYADFDVLQKMLNMSGHPGEVDATGKVVTTPEAARTSQIQIRLSPGVDLEAARAQIAKVVQQVRDEQQLGERFRIDVQTWLEANGKFLGAIEREKVLVTLLFGIISLVAVFLIFCIFYMIVAEKTRDIGIIKSVGATNSGVAGIYLGYGATIGVVGGGLGLLIAYLVCHNINELHAWLGKVMGVQIWSAETYQFDRIPDTMNPRETAIIVSIAFMSSVLGAVLPAVRAARLHPVEALRWE